ncbi:MAG: ABC transporter ATP-binding protein [Polynucleobacter sp.]|nr:MAG: ABC transporter ATP-binding protein [Polynucleobacter sp.]
MTLPMSFIQARHLVKTYGVGEQLVHALNDVSVDIEQGEFVAIVGASGSGKSTFMNMIGCLDQPSSGSCLIAGEDIAKMDANALASLRNRRIGFVFQQFNLLARTSAIENVALPLLYARDGALAGLSKQDRLTHAKERLEQVGLGERLLNTPAQLSGGQQQRVAIARALVNDPDLILADEPTGALDSKTSAEVMELLTSLNQQGMTVIVVTHEPDVAAYAQRVITFKDGQILSDEKNTARLARLPHIATPDHQGGG